MLLDKREIKLFIIVIFFVIVYFIIVTWIINFYFNNLVMININYSSIFTLWYFINFGKWSSRSIRRDDAVH